MRPTWAEINLANLAANFRVVRDFVGGAAEIMAVVKADAYGHGAIECAQTLDGAGAAWFGVALPEEALELRENKIDKPILSLGGFWHDQAAMLLRENITPVIFRLDMAETLNRAACEQNLTADVHVKIDTGMGRLGVRFDEIVEFADQLKTFENLRVDGLMTHFAAADDSEFDEFTAAQTAKFDAAVTVFHEKGFRPRWFDLANSPATLAHRQTWGNLVRVGGALYGIGKDIFANDLTAEIVSLLKPVMSLRSEVTLLKKVPAGETLGYSCSFRTTRDSVIATIPIGYNDGLPRTLAKTGAAIINDFRVPVVGRVSMDLILLDVTDAPDVKLFDEVILIGHSNNSSISAEDLARAAETISYEITCGISRRVPRRFVND